MTFSNGIYNPNPFANPFNNRLGPSNFSYNPCGSSYHSASMKINSHVSLPEPIMYGDPRLSLLKNSLEVPNLLDYASAGPLIDRIAISLEHKNTYTTPDGTVYDLDTHKIVFQKPDIHSSDEWGSCKVILQPSMNGDWNNADIYRLDSNEQHGMHVDDVSRQYWQLVEQTKDTSMTDLQIELLADLEAGNFVGKSKLIDDV